LEVEAMSSSTSILPVWVQYVQALALPMFTVVIAGIAAWVGWQQMQLNLVKLQSDLYERRYKVFEAMRALVRHAAYQTELDEEEIRAYAFTAGEAVFLFDDGDGVAGYVQKMRDQVSNVREARKKIGKAEGREREELQRLLNSQELYLKAAVDPTRRDADNLITKFKPSLKLPMVRTFPWQRA